LPHDLHTRVLEGGDPRERRRRIELCVLYRRGEVHPGVAFGEIRVHVVDPDLHRGLARNPKRRPVARERKQSANHDFLLGRSDRVVTAADDCQREREQGRERSTAPKANAE
jgi:hypothetical protein